MEYRKLPHGTENEKFGVLGIGMGGIGKTPVDEIEAIVYSGTKINITYFLEEVIDEDKIYDLLEYFKESDSDSVDDAMEEMGDCTEEEVRLVRIKFLSEFGN